MLRSSAQKFSKIHILSTRYSESKWFKLFLFYQFSMGTHRKGSLSLFQVIAVVLMCRVTVACAAVPDELEGLAGRVLQASSEIPARDSAGETKASDSVSFVQPVEDEVVRKHFL